MVHAFVIVPLTTMGPVDDTFIARQSPVSVPAIVTAPLVESMRSLVTVTVTPAGIFTDAYDTVPPSVALPVGLNAGAVAVAANVAGLPVMPVPVTVAVNVFAPGEPPSVQLPTAATPAALPPEP